MIINKGLKVILSMVIAVSLLTPFNIHADTTTNTAPFIGVNANVISSEQSISSLTLPTINFGTTNPNSSLAYITGKMECTSPSTPTTSAPCDVFTLQNPNGNSSIGLTMHLNLQQWWLKANGNVDVNSNTFYIIDYEFILDDSYKGYAVINGIKVYINGSSFHHTVRQTGLTEIDFNISDYNLTRISNPIMWDIPIESYGFITYALNNYSQYVYKFQDLYLYQFPVFQIDSSINLYQIWARKDTQFNLIFIDNWNTNNQSSFFNHYELDNVTINNISTSAITMNTHIINIKFTTQIDGWYYFKSKYTYGVQFVPIYFNFTSNKAISTDFALNFGLTNRMLDDINLLANGNQVSSSAVTNNDSTNQQLESSSNQLFTQEDSFKTDMNNAMQNIPQFTVNNFGSKFMSSAIWVRQQYERMTNNTPFQQVITFSLLVGLSMILIGKVRK